MWVVDPLFPIMLDLVTPPAKFRAWHSSWASHVSSMRVKQKIGGTLEDPLIRWLVMAGITSCWRISSSNLLYLEGLKLCHALHTIKVWAHEVILLSGIQLHSNSADELTQTFNVFPTWILNLQRQPVHEECLSAASLQCPPLCVWYMLA